MLVLSSEVALAKFPGFAFLAREQMTLVGVANNKALVSGNTSYKAKMRLTARLHVRELKTMLMTSNIHYKP
jgi:hypothetical protein